MLNKISLYQQESFKSCKKFYEQTYTSLKLQKFYKKYV